MSNLEFIQESVFSPDDCETNDLKLKKPRLEKNEKNSRKNLVKSADNGHNIQSNVKNSFSNESNESILAHISNEDGSNVYQDVQFHLKCNQVLVLKKQLEQICKPKFMKEMIITFIQNTNEQERQPAEQRTEQQERIKPVMRCFSIRSNTQVINASFRPDIWSEAYMKSSEISFTVDVTEFLEHTALSDVSDKSQTLEWILTKEGKHIFHIPSYEEDIPSWMSSHFFQEHQSFLLGDYDEKTAFQMNCIDLHRLRNSCDQWYKQIIRSDVLIRSVKSLKQNRTNENLLLIEITPKRMQWSCNKKVQNLKKSTDDPWPFQSNGVEISSQKACADFDVVLLEEGIKCFGSNGLLRFEYTEVGANIILLTQYTTFKEADFMGVDPHSEFSCIQMLQTARNS